MATNEVSGQAITAPYPTKALHAPSSNALLAREVGREFHSEVTVSVGSNLALIAGALNSIHFCEVSTILGTYHKLTN